MARRAHEEQHRKGQPESHPCSQATYLRHLRCFRRHRGAFCRVLIRWTEENATKGAAMPPEAAKMAQVSRLAAGVGFWLSFPMLFFMGAASHYAMFGAR